MAQTSFPRISIVTPSYNQGKFLEEAIQSVIGQNYPNLEYIIMDGGSTDHSVDIIRKHEKHIAFWQSQKDNGQAEAINKGFSMATGDILGWLNSDDFYLPGAFLHISKIIDVTRPQLLFGDCVVIREDRGNKAYAMVLKDREGKKDLLNGALAQSSAFWTKQTWFTVGLLDTDMSYAFDLEWFNRAKKEGIPFIHVPKHLSAFRSHEACKTNSGGEERLREIARIYGKYRNQDYENVFLGLVQRRSRVKNVERLLRNTKLLSGTRARRCIFKLLIPDLKSIAHEDFDYFVRRLIGPRK
jgi:glycosyltransferase involved in cell wall biosynthesis